MAWRLARKWRILLVLTVVSLLGMTGWAMSERYLYGNFHRVVRGKVYRSAQPDTADLKKRVSRFGIKAIVNLRGDEDMPIIVQEIADAKALGVEYISIHLPNNRLPDALGIRELARVLESAPRPLLLHCKSGADRTGLASVMAAMCVGNQSYQAALEQLSLKYFHFDASPEHVTGVLDQYEEYCRQAGTDTGGWTQFRQWLFEVYDQEHHKRGA